VFVEPPVLPLNPTLTLAGAEYGNATLEKSVGKGWPLAL